MSAMNEMNEQTGQKMFLVGQWKRREWEVQGIFSSEDKALVACRGAAFFIMPLILDKEAPVETVVNEEAYFPYARGNFLYYKKPDNDMEELDNAK